MAEEQINWTVLPTGVDGRQAQFSVLVSPRLMPSGPSQLGSFPNWLDWPSTLETLDFAVEFGDGSVHPVRRIDPPASPFKVWTTLFSASTPVRPWELPPLKGAKVFSYPADRIQTWVRERYTELAAAGVELPEVATLAGLDPLDGLREESVPELLAEVEQQVDTNQFYPRSPAPNTVEDFAEFYRFYQRPEQYPDRKASGDGFPELEPPELDVHDALGFLSNHPHLMRLMGLVLDMWIEPVNPLPEANTTVRLVVRGGPRDWDVEHVRPRTRCGISLTQGVFVPSDDPTVPGGPDVARGFLRLNDTQRFAVLQLDTDGAAAKLLNLRANLLQRQQRSTASSPEKEGAPVLRNDGLAVTRRGRAERSVRRFERQTALYDSSVSGADPGSDTLLGADDLVRGWAVEVLDTATDRWRSLTRRETTYTFPAADERLQVSEQGFVTAAMTSAADPDLPADHYYQQESMFTWNGWSLVAPRPGRAIDNDDDVVDGQNEPIPGGFEILTTSRPTPGTLPRLRYGRTYRIRARAMDVAGNLMPAPGVDLDDPGFATATPQQFFGRFEPIPSPTVVPATPRGPAESERRAAIRSDIDTPLSRIESAGRHVAPPKSSQIELELHGRFDPGADGPMDQDAWDLLVAREGATFTNSPERVLPTPDAPERDWYYPVDELDVPYLADPLALGARISGLPGSPGNLFVLFDEGPGASWPDVRAFRVEAVPSDTLGHDWNAANRVLRVLLPKAERVELDLSCFMDGNQLGLWGPVRWLEETGQLTNEDRVRIISGQHWMFTPRGRLTLVHAVRRPLVLPSFFQDRIDLARDRAATNAVLSARIPVDPKSTARMELLASWTEFVDDGPGTAEPDTQLVQRSVAIDVRVQDSTIASQDGATFVDVGRIPHEFGDTKHRVVTYEALATTRFPEYFTERVELAVAGTDPVPIDGSLDEGVVRGTVVLRKGDTTFVEGTDYVVDHDNGTVARTADSAIDSGTGVEVEFVRGPITRISAGLERPVPSSERPDAPRVRSVVPTFAWSASGSGLNRTSTRQGNSVRIYLERPWWSSGAGELLGVVLAPEAAYNSSNELGDQLGAVVTRIGNDPVHNTTPFQARPRLRPQDFPLRVRTGSLLHLEELPDQPLLVAGHEVSYDGERDLWYSDLELDVGRSYWPFLRLALCRYQPESIPWSFPPNAIQISTVVVPDPIQLAPRRQVVVEPLTEIPGVGAPAQPTALVTVSGPAYLAGASDTPAPTEVRVRVQRRSGDGELDWDDVSTTTLNVQPFVPGVGPIPNPDQSWRGAVTVGSGWQGQVRLVIEEHELLRTDGFPVLSPDIGRRLVHQDLIEL